MKKFKQKLRKGIILNSFNIHPYCAVIVSFNKNGSYYFYEILANDVDGFIAASKTFIEEQDSFKNSENTIFIDERNEDAIAIYDYLHTSENLPYYKQDTEEFRVIFGTALQDEMYTQEHLSTTANGVTLRLLHIQPAFSDIFLNYKDTVQMPVVLARGLWSNLYTWKEFGEDLANKEGRDTWLIEITGGPGQDCDDCPNYDFDDLTDSYVPALLNKVLSETGKSKLQYVGFSNGCRATLSSLEKGSFDPSKVDTFVGVGCPGAFDGESIFSKCFNLYGNQMRNIISTKTHVTASDIGKALIQASGDDLGCKVAGAILNGKGEVSFNLVDEYLNWIASTSDSQPGIGLSLNKFLIIRGFLPKIRMFLGYAYPSVTKHDLMVTQEDTEQIYDNINSDDKKHFAVLGAHGSPESIKGFLHVADSFVTKSIVKKTLNNEPMGGYNIFLVESNSGG